MFEKNYFQEIFSEKRALPQKVALETLSPVLTTLLTIFRQKSNFSTKFWKTPPPPLAPPPPFWKKNMKLIIFPEINFFQEKFIWADKETILTICFQSSKNICRMSRISFEDNESTKKDRLPKKTLHICRIQFSQSCWNFSKIVRNFALKFHENKHLDFRKKFFNCL